jgi:hypothetical protein
MHIAGYAPPSHGLLVVLDRLTGLLVQARDGDRLALGAAIGLSQAEVWRVAAHLVGQARPTM